MEPAVGSVTGKVVDLLCGVAKKEISYTWNWSENVEVLKNEIEKLKGMKGRVQQQVDLATSKGELLLEGVQEWMNKADVETSNAIEFIAEEAEATKTWCNLRLCVNLSTLRRYSKTAINKTFCLQQHQENGKSFETCVSLPAPVPQFVDLYQSKNLEEIDTQKSTLKKIIEAIEDDKIQVVGVSGLGGVGKTTLASEVAKNMKTRFAEIVFVTVSQDVNPGMIKKQVEVAATKIINGEKVLIVLDDVWEEVEFEKLGIPCGNEHMNCKILVTSRSRDVCAAMNANVIELNPLQSEEAWTLFERVVGESEWDGKLKQVALQIVKECGGLPLFIQAVGKALKRKEIKIWEAALRRLQDPTDEDIPFKRKQILQLKLSYDHLENEVAKSCFLLCSMFPEDEFIHLGTLIHYGLALGMLNNADSIHDAEDRVRMAVDSLISSFLLLPSKGYADSFKMHDLNRDMALFITSKGDDKFLVKSGKGLREWQPRVDDIKRYKKISLIGNHISKLPDDQLDSPHLDTFLIQRNQLSVVPNEFFRAMKKLKVLDMSSNNISSLPHSLKQLKNLLMLDLSQNRYVCEISILGEITCLEILKLRSTAITNIPEEIGRLTKLRLLDVYYCPLSYVTPDVISKLVRLEELYLCLTKEGNCNFLGELSELSLLKVLYLSVPELHQLPKIETLIKFNIGNHASLESVDTYKRRLEYSGHDHGSLPKPIRKLIQLTELLNLSSIKDLDHILPGLYQEGFDELGKFFLFGCENVRSLVKTCDLDTMEITNEHGRTKTKGKFFSQVKTIRLGRLNRLELLWDNPHHYISFCNLKTINIDQCPSLLKLFPVSVAQGLVNLRYLYISVCKSLMVVISDGDEQTTGSTEIELVKQDIIHRLFPLTTVSLHELPRLKCFYSGHSTVSYPFLESIDLRNCHSMKRWSNGENHTTKIKFYYQQRECTINDYLAGQPRIYGNLKISEGSNVMSARSLKNELVQGEGNN